MRIFRLLLRICAGETPVCDQGYFLPQARSDDGTKHTIVRIRLSIIMFMTNFMLSVVELYNITTTAKSIKVSNYGTETTIVVSKYGTETTIVVSKYGTETTIVCISFWMITLITIGMIQQQERARAIERERAREGEQKSEHAGQRGSELEIEKRTHPQSTHTW